MPSALAVLRLITSSNLTGAWDWKLARTRALENAIGIRRRAAKIIGQVNAIGQQAPQFQRRNETDIWRAGDSERERYDLHAMGDQ